MRLHLILEKTLSNAKNISTAKAIASSCCQLELI